MSLVNGYVVVNGPPGINGRDGRQGPEGRRGPTGPPGEVYYAGETGPTGPTGSAPSFLFGKQIPNNNFLSGKRGDVYLNYDSWDIFNYNINWNFLGNIKGGTGPTGCTGQKGEQGYTGATGPSCCCKNIVTPNIPIRYFETTDETITGSKKYISGECLSELFCSWWFY